MAVGDGFGVFCDVWVQPYACVVLKRCMLHGDNGTALVCEGTCVQ